jgi:tetratricopeptide (TPR) repeat protein
LHPDDIKAMRPVARIHFLRGRLKVALSYYQQIIREDPNHFDYMNMGHVLWCSGDIKGAVSQYMLSATLKDSTLDQFFSGFNADRKYLQRYGISGEDIQLVSDYIRFQIDGSH